MIVILYLLYLEVLIQQLVVNSLKLLHVRSHYDLKKYSFCSRVVGLWNSLPDCVVSALSVNSFKNNLDRYWAEQEMYFNWKVDLTGSNM